MVVDTEKLARLQKAAAAARIGNGKGTPRRVVKRTSRSNEADDKQLQSTLKKLDAQTIPDIQEANFFQNDGKVLHFDRVAVQAAASSNTFGFYGKAEEKDIAELVPNILSQLGSESLDALRVLAEKMQAQQALAGEGAAKEAGDEEIPELVEGETFEDNVE